MHGSKAQITHKIKQIIIQLKKEFPDIGKFKSSSDPLDVLIATILSQNTTDKTSFKAFENLKRDFKSWEEVMNSSHSKILRAIKVCGLGNQKSKSIKKILTSLYLSNEKLSMQYLQKMSDQDIYKELLKFSGVGLKTISCLLAFGLGRDVFPVDTHVHRIVNRLGLVHTRSPEKTFYSINELIPRGEKFIFHRLLIRFGRKICRARMPLCGKCRLYDYCGFSEKEKFLESKLKSHPKENNFIILEHV